MSDVIRQLLARGRASAIARMGSAAEVAAAKDPFDTALQELALLREAVELAGSLPLSVPEARYDDLLRLDELHRRVGVLPAASECCQPEATDAECARCPNGGL